MRKYYLSLLGLLAACGAPDKPATTATVPLKPIFDVPALLGKDIDQVKQVLGKPEQDDEPDAVQMKMGIIEWEKSFKRDTAALLVTYDAKTRKVTDFFISTNHGKTADTAPLLQLANLKEGAAGFSIEPVPMLANPALFTGVKAVIK